MKVKATEMYEKLNIQDKELNRIPKKGEEFLITKERFKELTNNKYKVRFVEEVIEKAVKEIKIEKAVKKTTRKKA